MLASAGLKRLGLSERIAFETTPEEILPACGQGILGIETREDDPLIQDIVATLKDAAGEIAGRAERALNRHLNGGCRVPIAAYAIERDDQLWLRALVGSADCGTLLKAEGFGKLDDVENLGIRVAEDLIAQGAKELLAQAGLY